MKNYISEVIVQLSSNEASFRRERLYVNKLKVILVQVFALRFGEFYDMQYVKMFTVFMVQLQALECLVRLASVRRSLFANDVQRSKFMAHLMTGTKEILQAAKVTWLESDIFTAWSWFSYAFDGFDLDI
ncbi:hypothetical protein Scep_021718 [Stephania cephalantha]|uniref:Uncharacterized protein n=1 Tax=Stephania cephalantha TaxID=152367 RepID=A0AAP0FEK4_9MAGN